MEKIQGIHNEQRRTQEELANPNADLRYEKATTYGCRLLRRSAAVFSGQTQVDAAAEVEDDGERSGGGGARTREGLREEEGE